MALLTIPLACRTKERSRPAQFAWLALSALLLVGAGHSTVRAAPAEAVIPEYQVKAVFLYNFTQFVEWPPAAFPDAKAPLIVGILGDDPFGTQLDTAVAGEKANGRSIVVRRYRSVLDATMCHILYVSPSENARLDSIFSTLKGKATLTVGEAEGFATGGGMIRFITNSESKLRLRVNLQAAQTAGLTISSKLLRAAEIVDVQPK